MRRLFRFMLITPLISLLLMSLYFATAMPYAIDIIAAMLTPTLRRRCHALDMAVR